MANKNTTIPKGWKVTTLGKALYPISDTFKFNGTERVHFLNTGDILEGKLLHKNLSSTKTLPGQAKKRFKLNDILYSEIRPANKRYMLVNFESSNSVASTKLMVLRTKENVDVKYIYKFITFRDTINQFQVIAESRSGTFPQITFDSISNIEFVLPPLPEQRAIAAVLSSLDDKIELLREQNKTLEATAQAIFKEWFVNFNFPGSTGKMIDSELGKIPEGWKVKKFGDIFKIEYGRSDKKFDEDGESPVYGAGGIVGYSNSNDYQGYQIIIGCRGTCGNITLAYEDSKITHNSLVVSNEWFNPFSYLFLQTIDIKRAITGSTQPQITIGDLANIGIYVPEDIIIKLFSENIKSIFEKIKNNSSQIQTISTLRDTLLPKLMKGEIRVEGFNN